MFSMLKSIWSYRQFILSSIRNDVITRYMRSKLGGAWAVLNPLAQVLIYALIFSNILAAKLPDVENKYAYAIYLMSGLLAWNLFIETVSRCLNIFIEYANLMKKMQFPRITLPVIIAGGAIVNNLLLLASMLVIFVLIGHHFTWHIIFIIPLTFLLLMFAVGLGLMLGVFNVFVRDIGQGVPVLLQVLFWFTPIVYPLNIVPEAYRHFLEFNPVFHFTHSFQSVLVYHEMPDLISVAIVSAISLPLLAFSLFLFRRAQAEIVDVL